MSGDRGKCGKVAHGNHATFKKVAYHYVVIEHFSSTHFCCYQAFFKLFKRRYEYTTQNLRCLKHFSSTFFFKIRNIQYESTTQKLCC
jgi:hypothetical protein